MGSASLFVCGMTDRDFPRQHPQNLLFPDSDIDRLHAAGIPLRKAADQDRQEDWLFDSLRTRAAQSLFLTCPAKDAAGKSLQCSRSSNSPPSRPRRAVPRRASRLLSQLFAGRHLRSGAAGWHGGAASVHQPDRARRSRPMPVSVLRQRRSRLKGAPDRPGERLNPRVTGSILHIALERWLTDTQQTSSLSLTPPSTRCAVTNIFRRATISKSTASAATSPGRSAPTISGHPTPPKPKSTLTIEFPGGIQVNCRIDRIDRFDNDCVIVDYKSSKTANVEKLVTSGTRLQGPLYALAVRESLT